VAKANEAADAKGNKAAEAVEVQQPEAKVRQPQGNREKPLLRAIQVPKVGRKQEAPLLLAIEVPQFEGKQEKPLPRAAIEVPQVKGKQEEKPLLRAI